MTRVELPTYPLCGVTIAAVTTDQATDHILAAAVGRKPLEVHLCNVYTLSLLATDERLRAAINGADLNLPDGAPVAWLGPRRGPRLPVRGADLLRSVVAQGRASDVAHFFYGGLSGVAENMASQLAVDYPGVRIAGTHSPPLGEPSLSALDDLANEVKARGTSVLWIGLGTPKQDYVVPLLAQRLGLPVVPVGAAFDFLARRVGEAPAWMHGSGLEWAHRLSREPRRLGARYALGTPRFVALAIRYRRK